MCLLIVLRGQHREHPIVVAANRDERRDRPASPPGLWVGRQRRVISPRDRRAAGTWLGVSDRGLFAGITNVAGEPPVPDSPSRGQLPHLALDAGDLDAAAAAVQGAVRAQAWSPFQLVLCDGLRTIVLRQARGGLTAVDWQDPVLVVGNEHAPGELHLPGMAAALAAPAPSAAARLDALRPLLLDRGGPGRHAALKSGPDWGTVSSSLIAVPADDPRALVWRYAAGPPDVAAFRDYGNLGRRLLPEADA